MPDALAVVVNVDGFGVLSTSRRLTMVVATSVETWTAERTNEHSGDTSKVPVLFAYLLQMMSKVLWTRRWYLTAVALLNGQT